MINKSAVTNQSPDMTSKEPSNETTKVDDQQSGPVNGCVTEYEEDKGEQRATSVYLLFHSRIFLTHKLI